MTPDDVTAIQQAFSQSLEPVMTELRGIHQILHNIEQAFHADQPIIDGVEILVRSKTG